MCVPTAFSGDVVSLHCFITAKEIFEDATEPVVKSWLSVGTRWPFIEVCFGTQGSLVYGLLECVVYLPIFLYLGGYPNKV